MAGSYGGYVFNCFLFLFSQSLGAFIPVQIITKPSLGESLPPHTHTHMCNHLPGLLLLHLAPLIQQPPPEKPSSLPFQAPEEQGQTHPTVAQQ